MSADAFDTNIFIYLFDERDLRKQRIASALVQRALAEGDVAVSYQVVQEALNALTRKLLSPPTREQVSGFLAGTLAPLWQVMPSPALFERALGLSNRYQLHFYDALVVAGALQAGCARLLTEDLQHGQQIDGLVIENPFLE